MNDSWQKRPARQRGTVLIGIKEAEEVGNATHEQQGSKMRDAAGAHFSLDMFKLI